MKLLFMILFNGIAVWIASWIVPGFDLTLPTDHTQLAFWISLFIAGLLLLIVNKAIKPILQIILFPAIILSLGLVSFFLNLTLLWIYSLYIPELTISGFWPLVWGSFVISLVNTLSNS